MNSKKFDDKHRFSKSFGNPDLKQEITMNKERLGHVPDRFSGVLVIKNENGEHKSIEDQIREIDSEIEDKESEMYTTNDPNLKKGLKGQIKSLQDNKKELTKDAMKPIDLNHKALIFLDTPNHTF
jgi:hypothetical protein